MGATRSPGRSLGRSTPQPQLFFLFFHRSQNESFWNPRRDPDCGQFLPADSSGAAAKEGFGRVQPVCTSWELSNEARSLQLSLASGLRNCPTLACRSTGSQRHDKGGKKSQAVKWTPGRAGTALPSETRFFRSCRSPPEQPLGYFHRRGSHSATSAPKSQLEIRVRAPGRAPKYSRPSYLLRPFPLFRHPSNPQLFIDQRVNIRPAHLDRGTCTLARTLPEAYAGTHGSLAPRSLGERAGRARWWAESGREAWRRSLADCLLGATCPRPGRSSPPSLPSCAPDPKRGFLWSSGFLHPDSILATQWRHLFLAALQSLVLDG